MNYNYNSMIIFVEYCHDIYFFYGPFFLLIKVSQSENLFSLKIYLVLR